MNDKANQRLFKQLDAPAPKFDLPASYTFSVMLSLTVSLLLILLYFAVLGGFAWLTTILLLGAIEAAVTGHSVVLAMFLLVGTIVSGFIFISLTKPFSLAFGKRHDQVTLSRHEEPLLHTYVDQICETLNTPRPQVIRLELAPNASAGPASVIKGLFTQNLVLSLGMPLALGLNIQQLSGVIAHELGHFSQSGGGTDLSRLLQIINAAFGKIALDQDWLDELLAHYSQPRYGVLSNVLFPLRFGNYASRRFFYLLMLAGHASSSFETRQKEFDADAYETYLAGYEAFRHCSRNLELLGAGYQTAMNDLEDAWQDRRLMDNLPALTVANATRMPMQRQRQLYRLALTRKTQWHDSHPSPIIVGSVNLRSR
jgi:Zn-dependent protease with chaperone function